jgi:hypothetical protein
MERQLSSLKCSSAAADIPSGGAQTDSGYICSALGVSMHPYSWRDLVLLPGILFTSQSGLEEKRDSRNFILDDQSVDRRKKVTKTRTQEADKALRNRVQGANEEILMQFYDLHQAPDF